MTVHLLCISGATALIVLVTLLPFMPGSYDPFSAPLSVMATVFGFAGLLFVPVGALWTALARWRRVSERECTRSAVAALIVWSIVSCILSMAAFALVGLLLGVVTLAFATYAEFSLRRRIATIRIAGPARRRAPALYLLIVALAVFLVQQSV